MWKKCIPRNKTHHLSDIAKLLNRPGLSQSEEKVKLRLLRNEVRAINFIIIKTFYVCKFQTQLFKASLGEL